MDFHVNQEHGIEHVWDVIYEAQCDDACLHVCGCCVHCVACTVYVECAFPFLKMITLMCTRLCLCVSVHHMYAVLTEVRRGH